MPTSTRRVLVLFAHPALQRSRVNRHLIRGLDRIDGVTMHDLNEAYPRFDIDVAREQELIESHDVIVLQHPFYWYSTPALLKEYQDLVLLHGWAFGRGGTALKGKIMLNALSFPTAPNLRSTSRFWVSAFSRRQTWRRKLVSMLQAASSPIRMPELLIHISGLPVIVRPVCLMAKPFG